MRLKSFFTGLFKGSPSSPKSGEFTKPKSNYFPAEYWEVNRNDRWDDDMLLDKIKQYQNVRKAGYFFVSKVCQLHNKRCTIDFHRNPIIAGSRAECLTARHLPGCPSETREFLSQMLRESPDRITQKMARNKAAGRRELDGITCSVGVHRLAQVVAYLDSQLDDYEVTMDLFVFKNNIPEPCIDTGLYPTLAA